jgi:hypothetical protein
MMNRKIAHTAAATALVLALAATPVFAYGNRSNRGEDTERSSLFNRNCQNMEERGGRVTTMGTVSALDSKASMITIKNADGKEVQVHVNPQTYIKLADSNTALKFSDIKAGDWVGVNTFDTGTTTVEARCVFITRS